MNIRITVSSALAVLFLSSTLLRAQAPIESITKAELKDHIFFLASDYLNGRVGPSAEYEIAAQYVATQFAAAGIEPLIINDDSSKSYFQGVPFAKTTYGDSFTWTVNNKGKETVLQHMDDFKSLYINQTGYDNLEVVWAGYGIEEPDHNWNDFEDLDTRGKIIICTNGAPLKNGKPVLPEEVHQKYAGPSGLQSRVMHLMQKGAAGIILTDIEGSSGMSFEMVPGEFAKEKYVYRGDKKRNRAASVPSVFLVKPEFMESVMAGNRNNPVNNPDNILSNYKPQLLKGVSLSSQINILSEELIETKNVAGIVPGTDPLLKDEYIIVGAHLDHVKPVNGQVCNGADDNASGSAGVIEIAEALAINPCKRSVVFITYTAEEMGLEGSRHFVGSDVLPPEKIKFNLNMDMIGRSSPANRESRAHYVVSDKKYIDQIENFINELNNEVPDFPLIF
ncbi:MAG: M28 family peptidase, partial [Spirochaetales bacterium]|nr:M28 family peptidase [Spirochaetales bacterium]